MKAKKLLCLALATFGFAALFAGCEMKDDNELNGGDTTQQGSQEGQENQGGSDKEEQQKPSSGTEKPGSGAQGNEGNDKEEQQKPSSGTEKPGSGSENEGSQGEQSGSEGEGSEGSGSGEGQGGSEEPEKHEHSYTYRTLKEATCLEDGEEEGVCSCGNTTKRTITRLGHSYGEVQTDSKGQFQICTRCGYRDDIGETIEFTVNIVIEEGSDFQIDEKTQILVYKDSSVFKAYEAQEHTTFSLLRGKYVVRVDGFSDMYI